MQTCQLFRGQCTERFQELLELCLLHDDGSNYTTEAGAQKYSSCTNMYCEQSLHTPSERNETVRMNTYCDEVVIKINDERGGVSQ